MHCNEIRDKLIGYIEKDISIKEIEEIENHLRCCQDCEQVYLTLSKMDKVLSHVGRNYTIKPSESLFPEIIHKVVNKSKSTQKEKKDMQRKTSVYALIGVAAVFAIICISVFTFIYSTNPEVALITKSEGGIFIFRGENKIDISQMKNGVVKKNDQIVSNQDGFTILKSKDSTISESASTIFVDKNSQITLLSPRKISLKTGTIFCKVAKADKRFIVKTPYSDIIVKGTEFEVNVSKDGIKTSVVDGKVTVKSKKFERDITKGFSIMTYENGDLSDAAEVAVESIASWRNKELETKVTQINAQKANLQASTMQGTSAGLTTSQSITPTSSTDAGPLKSYTFEDMEKLLPETTVFYLSTNSITQLIEDLKSSKVGDILALPFVKNIIDIKKSEIDEELKKKCGENQSEVLTVDNLLECFSREIIFSINTDAKNFEKIDFLILANLGNNVPKFKNFLKAIYLPNVSVDSGFKIIDEGNTYILQYQDYVIGRKTLTSSGVIDSLYIYCTDSKILDSIRNPNQSQTDNKGSTNHIATFINDIRKSRTSKTNITAGFTLLPIKDCIMNGIKSETEKKWALNLFDSLGINNFQDIIANIEISGETIMTAYFDGNRTRAFDWLATPSSFNTLDYAPANALAFIGFHTINSSYIFDDIKDIYTFMRSEQEGDQAEANFDTMMNEFYQGIGNLNLAKDVFPYLGSEFSIVFGSDIMPVPKILFVAGLYDSQALQTALMDWVEKNKIPNGKIEYEGFEIYFVVPSQTGTISEIAFSFVDNYLVVGLGREIVKASIDAHKSGNTLDTNQKFIAVANEKILSASAILYFDIETLSSIWFSTFESQLRRSQIVADYEELKSVCKNFSASFIRINATSDSIELKTSTPFELLNPVFMLMVMPNFLEAQMRSKVSRTMADERSLATALESYFIDYNQYPDILHQLTSPVAYITSVPIDLYVPQAEGEGMYIKYIPEEDHKDWLIYSYGPDETDNKGQTLYDPTNGTISGGDIVRTHQ